MHLSAEWLARGLANAERHRIQSDYDAMPRKPHVPLGTLIKENLYYYLTLSQQPVLALLSNLASVLCAPRRDTLNARSR